MGELVRGRSVEFESSGEGDSVLLIHGAIVTDSFEPLMRQEMLARYRLIRYRRRGYGHSEQPSDPPTIGEHARDARDLLQELDVAIAHVVAHSGGGPVAVQLAVDYPSIVRSLVLIEPALQNAPMASAFDEMIAPLVAMHRAGESSKAVHLWMRTTGGPDWAAMIEQQIPGAVDQANRDASATFDSDLAALGAWDFDLAEAHRITQPVLYLIGERSGYSEAVTEMFQEQVPHCVTRVIPDADHNVQVAQPVALAAALAEFFASAP